MVNRNTILITWNGAAKIRFLEWFLNTSDRFIRSFEIF